MLSEPTNAIPCSNTVQASITRALAALDRKQYFKLIAGASLTNARAVAALAQVYGALAPARVACIDVAPDWAVVNAAHQVLQTLESPPLLMVSLDVDGDPHFRKAALDADVCTTCQACIPVCPTGAFQLTDSSAPGEHAQLQYHLPDCYGCGRCIPVCPVEALTLQKTETLPEAMVALLQHPAVGAVELHTEALNATTLAPLLITLGDALAGKLVSICFRPNANATQANAALTKLEQWLPQWAGLMFQVDGQPMSGTPDA
ncbi:MAG: 4Fe-4S dicluster domain-containing protein [Vampirovibrionales bacterium]|nr:4Fe-4S dicluster domain-containing protein [Vampirovibrionales bacterium]